jgi:hypothetical protein
LTYQRLIVAVNYTFQNCIKLSSINIPDNVQLIGEYAFSGCENLTDVTIGKGVSTINNYAFSKCGFTSIEIPDNVMNLGKYVFSQCSNLNDVTLGSGLNDIEDFTFYNCTNLKNINVPDNISNIGVSAFEESGLRKIEIPNSVKTIEENAFKSCNYLNDVYYDGEAEEWSKIIVGINNEPLLEANVHYISEEQYTIISLKLLDMQGTEINTPQTDSSYIAEMSIKENGKSNNEDCFAVAVYSKDGELLSINYAKMDIPTGSKVSFGIFIPKQSKTIGCVKAFAWDSFSGMKPLCESKELDM